MQDFSCTSLLTSAINVSRRKVQGCFSVRKPSGYWTYERCDEAAKLCVTKIEFSRRFSSAYATALKKGWLAEISNHMTPAGNRYRRYVYVIIDNENRRVYVGLTSNIKRRWYDHRISGRFDSNFTFLVISELLPALDASALEITTVEKYRNDGFTVLNKMKAGGLGGFLSAPRIWDYEACRLEAAKYRTRTEFYKGASGAVRSARKYGWLNDICTHMYTNRRFPILRVGYLNGR